MSLFKRHPLLILSIIFFVVRLYHLTIVPIFNDEAIYLDWGWREIHRPGHLFYSLYDAKPPLLMWMFGLMSAVFPDLLSAGRFVSVIFGYFSLVGIWKLTNRVFSNRAAILASLLYIAIPLFSFFDRQALMESAIGAVGVWTCYVVIRTIETKQLRWAIALGCVLGIGCFIKQNAILFFISSISILAIYFFGKREYRKYIFVYIMIVLAVMLLILTPLLVQQMFWQTLSSNTRYMVTPSSFSENIFRWMQTFVYMLEIMVIHLTPLPFAVFLIAAIVAFIKRSGKLVTITVWFLIGFLLDVLLIKYISERYVVSFLPITTVLMGYALSQIKHHIVRNIVVSITIATAGIITLTQIVSPLSYFSLLSRVSQFSFNEYTKGYTSGYGIPEAVEFLQERIGQTPAFIVTAVHTGNPESAVMVSFMKQKNVMVSYMEASIIKNIDTYDCLSCFVPIYFVSREEDTAGLGRFFDLVYFERNKVSGFGIGIYTLKQSCVGKTLPLRWVPT
jgi:4-amino-4-deoxy-L-arabinose transferase-like glycosyltransferase